MSRISSHDLYNGGYIQRTYNKYQGMINIEGVSFDDIYGVYFKEDGKQYLWLKRKPIMEYNIETQSYETRSRQPKWEVYMKREKGGTIAYRGEFYFLHIKYLIVGIWDGVLKDKSRLNLFVERARWEEQTIINKINERNNKKEH